MSPRSEEASGFRIVPSNLVVSNSFGLAFRNLLRAVPRKVQKMPPFFRTDVFVVKEPNPNKDSRLRLILAFPKGTVHAPEQLDDVLRWSLETNPPTDLSCPAF